jgi:branched-chain amino acid transport system permease protein
MTPVRVTRGSARHRAIVWGGGGLLAALVVALPLVATPYQNYQFTLVMVWAVAVVGVTVLTGFTGQISIANNAFFALGAYCAGYLMTEHGWPYLAVVPVAGVLAFAFGFVVGLPAVRLRGLYLALITMAVGVAAVPLIKRLDTITNGTTGLQVPPVTPPDWTGLASDQWLYLLVLVITIIMFLGARNLVGVSPGRAFIAMRENEIAAESMGVNVPAHKTLAFGFSAAYAGIAGSMYAIVVGFLGPDAFGLLVSVYLIMAAVVGGSTSIAGAVMGAAFIVYVPVYAGDVSTGLIGVIYGTLIVAVMLLMPSGLHGLATRLLRGVVRFEDPEPVVVSPQPAAEKPEPGGVEIMTTR